MLESLIDVVKVGYFSADCSGEVFPIDHKGNLAVLWDGSGRHFGDGTGWESITAAGLVTLTSAGEAHGVRAISFKVALIVAVVALELGALAGYVTGGIAAMADSIVFTVGGMVTGL